MSLASELRQQIQTYVAGSTTLADLRGWLEDHVQEIEDVDDSELDHLDGRVWNVLAELDYGHFDERRARTEFRQLLTIPSEDPTATSARPPPPRRR